MADEDDSPLVPEGAAVLPLIPSELGIHPLLLAVLHAVVFLDGSDEEVVNPDAAEEALEHLAGYLQRLEGDDLRRAREDMATLAAYARAQKWPKQQVRFLKDFLNEFGVGEGQS
ncbi:MAG TPA: hypothetical protein VFA26_15820 [Gemmataceae bacterium]|nr:hypothetical protein [Gemmataceae bacterium]